MNQPLIEEYKLRLENFEGPFDLLYHLIEKNEMDIYDIRIGDITDQYLEYLFDMQTLNLDIASDFLLMASTLLHIKSKMLLPVISDDEEDELDPREVLVRQLLEYKKYKKASFAIKELHEAGNRYFYGLPSSEDFGETKKVYEVSPLILKEMYKGIVSRNERKKNYKTRYMEKILRHDRFTVEKKIRVVIKTLLNNAKISFFEFFKKKEAEKLDVVVSFLSILELAKERKAKLNQNRIFSDIVVEKTDKLTESDLKEYIDIYK
ncbi:MAG: segregation/condensation protein A [Clostridia bacterium]|nr:segregation/condensation protein A [Clostridia bacterium]